MRPDLVVGLCIHKARVAQLYMGPGFVWDQRAWLWARAGCGVVRAWGQGCMVFRIGSEGRADCGWGQVWLCMVSGLVVHGVKVGLWG